MKKHPVAGGHARARTLRQNPTEAKRRVWQILRSQQMRQVPLGRYIADFVCHEAQLIIEIDGGQHDRSSRAEVERTGFLEREGYRVLRFWNNEVPENLDGVHATVAASLGPAPSPLMGEGRGGGELSAPPMSAGERAAAITPTKTLPHHGGGLSSGDGPR